MANANRHIDSFGPKLVFETYSETATHPGPVSYTMTSSTDDQHKYQQGLYESGMTRIYNDGSIQVESAAKKSTGGAGYTIICHNGDIIINANGDNGHIKINGADITIDAERNLTLRGDKIRIGGPSKYACDKIDLIAKNVNATGDSGNLVASLMMSSALKSIQGTLISKAVKTAKFVEPQLGPPGVGSII